MLNAFVLAAAVATTSPCTGPVDRSAEAARPAPPTGVAGTIVSVVGDEAQVRLQGGSTAKVKLTPGWTVSSARAADLRAVRIGQFVASANVNVAPGRGRANELRVFEPGYLPEFGTHQIGAPNTAMTHGFVFGMRSTTAATELDVYYPGGCRVIEVPAATKVTMYDVHPRAQAAPGTTVSAVTRPDPSGVPRAGRLVLTPAGPAH